MPGIRGEEMATGPKKPLFGQGSRGAAPDAATRSLRRAETRRSERLTAFKNGKVILKNGGAQDCIVRNVSADGCMITLIGAENLPDEVSIRVDVLSKPRPAQIVWRDKGVAGVKFLPTP
jgi:hypothetical protein